MVNGWMMGQRCQRQLFENRCFAWELFWVVVLSLQSSPLLSGSTVADLNWAASCVNCEMNRSVASQLNRTHSEQKGGETTWRALFIIIPDLSQSNGESRSVLFQPFEMPPKCAAGVPREQTCHTSAYRHNKSRPTNPPTDHLTILSSQLPSAVLYKSSLFKPSGAAFLWKTIALHPPPPLKKLILG